MGVIITGVNESLDIISRIELKHRNHQDDCKMIEPNLSAESPKSIKSGEK